MTDVKASDLVEQLAEANHAAVQAAVGCVPLHGSAIDSVAGVIVLAGRSMAGKSTLAAAAVLAGYPYVADELAAISPDDFTVRPYHRPIGLRRGGASAIGRRVSRRRAVRDRVPVGRRPRPIGRWRGRRHRAGRLGLSTRHR